MLDISFCDEVTPPKPRARYKFEKLNLARSIMEDVCKRHNISTKAFLSRSRLANLTKARREFCELTFAAKLGSPMIAKLMNRTYWTVLQYRNPLLHEKRNNAAKVRSSNARR